MTGLTPDWNAIESEGPKLTVHTAQFIGEGWTAVAYRVNDELVFKFPKRREEWRELDREIAFLAYARPQLPLPVAEHLYQVRDSAGAPKRIASQLSGAERRMLFETFRAHVDEPQATLSRSRILHADFSADHVLCVERLPESPRCTILPANVVGRDNFLVKRKVTEQSRLYENQGSQRPVHAQAE